MSYWLMKSEPGAFSIEDLRRRGTAGWDGVRNYQARNFIQAMKVGDLALFYHSNASPSGAAGVMEIVRTAYPDPTQFDPGSDHHDPKADAGKPTWFQVDVKWKETFARLLSLEEMRGMPSLTGMPLFQRSRLSVQPVTPAQWKAVLEASR